MQSRTAVSLGVGQLANNTSPLRFKISRNFPQGLGLRRIIVKGLTQQGPPTKYNWYHQNKEHDLGGAWSTHDGEECVKGLMGKTGGMGNLKTLGVRLD